MVYKNSILVVFTDRLESGRLEGFETIVGPAALRAPVESLGKKFVDIVDLIDPGSIYDASALLEELPKVVLPDGRLVSKAFTYMGYEMWWIHYNSFFHHFCIPFFQYKRLLEFVSNFDGVTFFKPPYKTLFSLYVQSRNRKVNIVGTPRWRSAFVTLGVLIQVVVTAVSLPFLMAYQRSLLVFIGDKFEKGKDYDFRMSFVYQELRKRKIPFVEFVRSLESWKTLVAHIFVRKRPVIYSEAIAFLGRFLSFATGDRWAAQNRFGVSLADSEADPEKRFRLLVATHYLRTMYDDVWATRLMSLVVKLIGIRVGLFTAALERNFHTVLGCKLNCLPTIGILHGVSSRHYNPYDFMNGFAGEKRLSLDEYGVWSEWWKSYYENESDTYGPQELRVSGPMRPLVLRPETAQKAQTSKVPRVLLIAEQTASPLEVMPYVRALMNKPGIEFTIKLRPFRDGFEEWLLKHAPDVLTSKKVHIVRGAMQEAIANADVVVGCHSTGVLEALQQGKVPIFMHTRKWGDYYNMGSMPERQFFLAMNPNELIEKIDEARTISPKLLSILCEQYFGDPQKNGSVWLVNRADELLKSRKRA